MPWILGARSRKLQASAKQKLSLSLSLSLSCSFFSRRLVADDDGARA